MTPLLALPLGLATGGLLGTLGAGGSVLTVPALVYLLDQPVGAATTASLVIVSANAAVGAATNLRRGTVDTELALRFGLASALGAVGGSYLATLASGETVLFLLAIVMLASAASLWRGRPERLAPPAHVGARRVALVAGLGVTVGLLTGFFGVGGGFLIVPALVLLLGVPVRIAIGTSLLVIALAGVAALVGHLSGGEVNWTVTLLFGAAGAVGVVIGSRASERIPVTALSRGFVVLLVAVAVFLLVRNGAALAG